MLCVLLVGGLAVAGVLVLGSPADPGLPDLSAGWADSKAPEASTSSPGKADAARGSLLRERRSTSSGAPSGWLVVGLGDSVVSGSNCDCTSFVQRYADLAEAKAGRPVRAQDLGVPGLTSGGLLDQLQDGSDAARTVAGADIVLVTIGANDAASTMQQWSDGQCGKSCFETQTAAMHGTVVQILGRILALRTGQPTEVLVTTYWNVVEDGAVARENFSTQYLQVSDALTRQVNGALCDATKSAADHAPAGTPGGELICVDLYAPFKGAGDTDPTALLAADGDHPDAAGHQLIAQTLAKAGWAALGVPA